MNLFMLTLGLITVQGAHAQECRLGVDVENYPHSFSSEENEDGIEGRKIAIMMAKKGFQARETPRSTEQYRNENYYRAQLVVYDGAYLLSVKDSTSRTLVSCVVERRLDRRGLADAFQSKIASTLVPTCAEINEIKAKIKSGVYQNVHQVLGCSGYHFDRDHMPVAKASDLHLPPVERNSLFSEKIDILKQYRWLERVEQKLRHSTYKYIIDTGIPKQAVIDDFKYYLNFLKESASRGFEGYGQYDFASEEVSDVSPLVRLNTTLVIDPYGTEIFLKGNQCKVFHPYLAHGTLRGLFAHIFSYGASLESGQVYGIQSYRVNDQYINLTLVNHAHNPSNFEIECSGGFKTFGEISKDLGSAISFDAGVSPLQLKQLIRKQLHRIDEMEIGVRWR